MLHTRFQSTLAVVGGSLWVIGGDVHQTERTVGTIEKYNEQTSLWEMITTFPKRREGCAICAVDSLIYVFGGCVGCQSFNDWDAYNVETDRWLSQDDINPIDLALCKINVDDSKGIKSCSNNNTATDNSINSNNNSNTNPDINRTKNSDYTSNSNTNSNNVSGVNGSNRPTMNSIIPPHLRNQSQSRLLFPIVACPARNSMSMLNGATAVTTCSS